MKRLADAMENHYTGVRVLYHSGFLKDYVAGGLHFARIANLIFCYLTFPFKILACRPHLVLVRTAPPGIQIVVSAICALIGTPCWLWLMDYHPELEARHLERKWWGSWIARSLRAVDGWALKNFKVIIAIDDAIADICRKRAPKVPVIVHPTWFAESGNMRKGQLHSPSSEGAFRGIYIGHLGYAHDLSGVQKVLDRLPESISPSLDLVNVSEAGQRRFQQLKHPRLIIETYQQKSLEELKNLIEENAIQWGLVCLGERYKGVLSPSKFHLYLELGLPVLYTGPSQTNAWKACAEFNAGIAITADSDPAEWNLLDAVLLDFAKWKELQSNCVKAMDYFEDFGPEKLAQQLEPLLKAVSN